MGMVKNFRFLGVQITNNLFWSPHADTIVKKALQRLSTKVLSQKAKEIWHVPYNCHQLLQMHHRKYSFWLYHSLAWLLLCPRLQKPTKVCERSPVCHANQPITQTSLQSIDSVYKSHCLGKAASIIKDPTHPGHSLFHHFPSGKRYKSLKSRTNRLKNSFFPAAIRLLNGPT